MPHWGCSVAQAKPQCTDKICHRQLIQIYSYHVTPTSMGCACPNKTPQPSVSSGIPLYYLYRVGVASFHFEQSSRPQHSLQDPAALVYLVSDVSRHHTGARLGASTALYCRVLISVGVKCTNIAQMKSVVHMSQVSKLGDGVTGIPGHTTVPISHRAFSLPLLL